MKKCFDAPEMEFIRFDSEDVITTSGNGTLSNGQNANADNMDAITGQGIWGNN